jgi:hypothetical protein
MTEHRTTYYAVLWDGGPNTYASTSFLAADKTEATQKARDWAKGLANSADPPPEDAFLQVATAKSVTVCSLRPGEF